ncbi:MAG: hypothetical protein ABI693_28195 [Bryobacteraceae bacterium]
MHEQSIRNKLAKARRHIAKEELKLAEVAIIDSGLWRLLAGATSGPGKVPVRLIELEESFGTDRVRVTAGLVSQCLQSIWRGNTDAAARALDQAIARWDGPRED